MNAREWTLLTIGILLLPVAYGMFAFHNWRGAAGAIIGGPALIFVAFANWRNRKRDA